MLDTQSLNHHRDWHDQRYCYAVASRRARGISIGINLNVDKICNFGCVYCEVNRGIVPTNRLVDRAALLSEVQLMLDAVKDGTLAHDPRFAGLTPPGTWLPVRDIAFSGDGEPTSFRNFATIMQDVIAARDAAALADLKIVVITNASLIHRPSVQGALAAVHAAGGEVWAKLDAGTPDYYRQVDATTIPYQRILDNLALLAHQHPIVVQTCFMRLEGQGPSAQEIAAYCQRLRTILVDGGRIDRVQIYTVSRPPAERYVTSLTANELRAIVAHVTDALPDILVEPFDGAWTGYALVPPEK